MPSSIKWVFCKKNLELHTQRCYEAFASKYPDEKIDVKDCAGTDLCSLCRDVPFVLRNGAIVNAKDERDLYWKLDDSMRFLTGEKLVTVEAAPPKEEGGEKPAAAAKPAEAPKAEAAPKAEEAPKDAVETKADESPKLD